MNVILAQEEKKNTNQNLRVLTIGLMTPTKITV